MFLPSSAVQEVTGHEQLQRDLGLDGELRDLGGAVGVADLVGEVHAHLLQHVGRDLPEVDLQGNNNSRKVTN